MVRSIVIVTAASLLLCLAGCAIPQGAPVYGGIYTQVKGTVGGVNDSVRTTKTGTAMAQSIVGVALGDASISAAMKAGGLTKIHHAETESFSIMSVYATHTVTVYGE